MRNTETLIHEAKRLLNKLNVDQIKVTETLAVWDWELRVKNYVFGKAQSFKYLHKVERSFFALIKDIF